MSLIQERMSIQRGLAWAKVITVAGAFFSVGNFIYGIFTPERVNFWSLGLNIYFVAMTAYGIFMWVKGRKRLKDFELRNGHDAGRQDPVQ